MRLATFAAAPVLLAWSTPPQTPAPAPQPSAVTTPGPLAPTSAASPFAAPTVSPTPASTPLPAPTVSPSAPPPSPSAPPYRFIYTPQPSATSAAPDAPHIVEIDFTDQTIHQNSDVFLRVLTSQTVANVVVSSMGHGLAVPQVGPGVFGGQSHIPSIPFFMLNRTYNIEVRAQTPDGRADSVTLPVHLVR